MSTKMGNFYAIFLGWTNLKKILDFLGQSDSFFFSCWILFCFFFQNRENHWRSGTSERTIVQFQQRGHHRKFRAVAPSRCSKVCSLKKAAKSSWSASCFTSNETFALPHPHLYGYHPLRAINQIRTKVKPPRDMPPPHKMCHPLDSATPTDMPPPMMHPSGPTDMLSPHDVSLPPLACHPPPRSAWRWRQRSALAFWAKSLLLHAHVACKKRSPLFSVVQALDMSEKNEMSLSFNSYL